MPYTRHRLVSAMNIVRNSIEQVVPIGNSAPYAQEYHQCRSSNACGKSESFGAINATIAGIDT